MKTRQAHALIVGAVMIVTPLAFSIAAAAQIGAATPRGHHISKGPSPGGIVRSAPSTPRISQSTVVAKKGPGIVRPTIVAKPRIVHPPVIAKRPIVRHPVIAHKHRPWRPGLRWRWIAVPSIFIAESLTWCHYHRYREGGMRYHSDVECHRHSDWNDTSIRYVTGY